MEKPIDWFFSHGDFVPMHLTDQERMLELARQVGPVATILNLMIAVARGDRFIYLNEEWSKTLGWRTDELIGPSWLSLVHPDDLNASLEIYEQRPGHAPRFRNRLRTKSGDYRDIEWVGTFVGDTSFALAQDVTAEVERERQHHVVAKAVNASNDAIIGLDPNGKILSWNLGAAKLLGVAEAEAVGRPMADFAKDVYGDPICKRIRGLEQSGEAGRFQCTWQRLKGDLIETDCTVSPVKVRSGQITMYLLVARDVTAKIRRASVYEQIEMTANIGGWEVNILTGEVFWTDQTYRIHELPLGEPMTVDRAIAFYSSASQPVIREALDSAIREGRPFDLELQIRTFLGNERWVRARGKALVFEGKAQRVFGSFQDVTAAKAAQLKLERQGQELARAEKLATLGELSATVAHEINNPLAILRAKAGILRRLCTNHRFREEEVGDHLESIERTVARMARIVSSLQSFASSDDRAVAVEPVDVVDTLHHVTDLLEARTVDLGAEVRVVTSGASPMVRADETHLFQVFSNLLANALDAVEHEQDKRIEFSVERAGDRVRVRVVDSGPGVPEEFRPQIFNTFFSTKGKRGTGLGLSLSRRLLESYGGRIWLDGSAAQTTFVVELPCADAQPLSAPGAAPPADRVRVLVVEDEADLVDSLKFFLEEAGFEAVVCGSANEALMLLREGAFAIVLCDYRLPDLSGEELMRLAEADGCASRWIFLTGYTDVLSQPDRPRQVAEVLRKPIDYREVVAAVARVASVMKIREE